MIAERRPVWIAQADLFLDTDVRLWFPYIARVAAASKYSLEELEAICRDEVAPIVEANLLDIAGEWCGFPDDWVVESILSRLETSPPVPYAMQTSAIEDWRAVAHLVTRLRVLPPERRQERCDLWDTMRYLFLDDDAPPRPGLPNNAQLLNWVYRHEMLPAYGRRGKAPEAAFQAWLRSATGQK